MYFSIHGSIVSVETWLADRVHHEQAIVLDHRAGLFEIGPVVLVADVLEHAHRDDLVGLALEQAVVLDLELDGQVLVALAAIGGLVGRDGDADAARAVFFGGKAHEGAPAAADVPHQLAGLEADLAADEVELGLLRLVDIGDARRASSRRSRSCACRARPCRRRSRCSASARRAGCARSICMLMSLACAICQIRLGVMLSFCATPDSARG